MVDLIANRYVSRRRIRKSNNDFLYTMGIYVKASVILLSSLTDKDNLLQQHL